MPVHDWKRVEAGIFHDFHNEWIHALKKALNNGILPPDFYAMSEQRIKSQETDVLTLQSRHDGPADGGASGVDGLRTALMETPPKVALRYKSNLGFYRRQQKVVAVRHVSGDDLIAVIEVVSQGNKSSKTSLTEFVDKAVGLLFRHVHLLVLDLHPPTKRDPAGIHGEIWEAIEGIEPTEPAAKPLTLAAYAALENNVEALVEPVAVGDALIDMPLFLRGAEYVPIPLEATYMSAFADVPRRWQRELE